MRYSDFKKQASWLDEEPVKKPVNRWGQVDVMDETGTMVPAQFDPSAYADAHVAAIEEKRKARNKELEPDEREKLYQKYLDEGVKYGDWDPNPNNVDAFLQMSPTDAMQAYTNYLNSWQPRMQRVYDEEGNYKGSSLIPDVPSDIIDAKFGGSEAMNNLVLGPPDSEERKALYRHLLSGMPTDTYDDMKNVVQFMYNHPVSDEEYSFTPDYPVGDDGFTDRERAPEAEQAWIEQMKDYLQRNVYDYLPKPENPDQITIESSPKQINAYNNRGKNWIKNYAYVQNPNTNNDVLTARNTQQDLATATPFFDRSRNNAGWKNPVQNSVAPINKPLVGTQFAQNQMNKRQSYQEFKKVSALVPGIPAFGPSEVKYKDPKTNQYVDYNTYNAKNPERDYKPGMTPNQRNDAFQNRMKDAVLNEQGGFWNSMYNWWSDGFNQGGFGPINPFAFGTKNPFFVPVKNYGGFLYNGVFSKDFANEPGTASYDLRQQALSSDRMKNEIDAYVDSGDFNDLNKMVDQNKNMKSEPGENPAMEQLVSYGKTKAASRAWDLIKQNPFDNIPKAASLFLKYMGADWMADKVQSPMMFYGSLIALLGGGALLSNLGGGGRDDDDDDDTPAGYKLVPYA